MDDLRERMEQLARRVDGAAAPDLEQVRERHARSRRTSALTLGVAFTVIAALLAFQMTRSGSPTTAPPAASGGPTSDTLTVWPDADTGAEPWRASPEQVITRFSYMVLGWSDPDIVAFDDAYELRPEPCPPNARCTAPLTVTTVESSPGGWSVRSVSHPQLAIEVGLADPAVALTGGSRVRFDLEIADDRAAHIGMVASNGCRDATAFDVGLDAGSHVLELPAYTPDDPACEDMGTGYLFAYATDDTTVPVGDPLLEAAAIEYPWLTVIPIYLEMEEPDASASATESPSELLKGITVTCEGDSTSLDGTRVAAGPMGVATYFEPRNGGYRWLIDGDVVPDEPYLNLPLAPGTHSATCLRDGDIGGGSATFDVVDPEGYWDDPSVDCAPPASTEEATPLTGPASWEDVLVWAVLPENLPEGFPEVGARFVGYPENRTARTIGMFLDPGDQLIRRLNVVRTGDAEWTVETVTCPIP